MKSKTIAIWLTRLLGLAVSSACLALAIGEGLDGLYRDADPMIYPFFMIMAVSLTGYVISWHWQKRGGELMIVGGLTMLVFHLLHRDVFTALAYGLPFIIVGILLIITVLDHHVKSRIHKKTEL